MKSLHPRAILALSVALLAFSASCHRRHDTVLRDSTGRRFEAIDEWWIRPGCTSGGHFAAPWASRENRSITSLDGEPGPWHFVDWRTLQICRGEGSADETTFEDAASCRPVRCENAERDCPYIELVDFRCAGGYCVTNRRGFETSLESVAGICLADLPRSGREAEVAARMQYVRDACGYPGNSCRGWPAQCPQPPPQH